MLKSKHENKKCQALEARDIRNVNVKNKNFPFFTYSDFGRQYNKLPPATNKSIACPYLMKHAREELVLSLFLFGRIGYYGFCFFDWL